MPLAWCAGEFCPQHVWGIKQEVVIWLYIVQSAPNFSCLIESRTEHFYMSILSQGHIASPTDNRKSALHDKHHLIYMKSTKFYFYKTKSDRTNEESVNEQILDQ